MDQIETVTWSDRQTKSAPCGTDRSVTESTISSSLGSDLMTSGSSYYTSSLTSGSEVTDTDSVTRSAPGDWSTNSSSPGTADPEDRLFYCFPYTCKELGGETEPEDYGSDADFSQSYASYESKPTNEESPISYTSASSSAHSKDRGTVKTFSPLQLDRWRQWRRDNGLDLVSSEEDSVGAKTEDSSSEDEDFDLGGINGGGESGKQYKAKVLKRLLANFDPKQTISYYRSLSSVTYRFDPNEFSLDCHVTSACLRHVDMFVCKVFDEHGDRITIEYKTGRMSTLYKTRNTCLSEISEHSDDESSAEAHRMRSRLIHLTGSDTIKVNDKDYMEKLRAKIWQEHEAELKRKELEREDNERQRMRRLLARGIIEPEQLREDCVLWLEYKSRSNLYDKAYRGKRRKSSPRKDPGDLSARAKSAPQSRQHGKRVGLCLPPTEVSSTRAYGDSGSPSLHHYNHVRPATSFARYSDTYDVSGDTRQVSFSRHTMTLTPSVSSSSSRSVQTPEPRDKQPSRRTTAPPTNNNNNSNSKQKYEPPIIQEMRREETVAGLYRLAEIACNNEL